jgi:murein L,D-transpeptidase YafK
MLVSMKIGFMIMMIGLWAGLGFGSFDSNVVSLAPTTSNAKLRSEMMVLKVDKTSLVAHLQTLPKNPVETEVLASFRIAIGKAVGDKQKEGDNRTPEGIYFAQPHIGEDRLWTQKYGPRAIPINFPNPMDRKEGKTGYGIWLHGAGDDARIKDKNVTEGCVAFYNDDIVKITSWLPPHQGLVVIASDVSQVNRIDESSEINRLTQAWFQDWQQRNLDGYISYYSEDFVHQRKGTHAYRQYKDRVFKRYRSMKVDISDLRVVSHPKYAVSLMNQSFNGDDIYRTEGRKILFWERDNADQWRIVREVFEPRRYEALSFSESDLASLVNHLESAEGVSRIETSTTSEHPSKI